MHFFNLTFVGPLRSRTDTVGKVVWTRGSLDISFGIQDVDTDTAALVFLPDRSQQHARKSQSGVAVSAGLWWEIEVWSGSGSWRRQPSYLTLAILSSQARAGWKPGDHMGHVSSSRT